MVEGVKMSEEFKPWKTIAIDKDKINYLSERWEIREQPLLFSWAINLLHDLTIADEAGWRLTLSKSEFDPENKKMICNKDYVNIIFLLEWLIPTKDIMYRIPLPEKLEELGKIKREENI